MAQLYGRKKMQNNYIVFDTWSDSGFRSNQGIIMSVKNDDIQIYKLDLILDLLEQSGLDLSNCQVHPEDKENYLDQYIRI